MSLEYDGSDHGQGEQSDGASAHLQHDRCVPTFKRPEALRLTLAALRDLDYPRTRLQLVVVGTTVRTLGDGAGCQ